MCVNCIKRKCSELSDLIFQIKEKITDNEFKTIMDTCKTIFEYSVHSKSEPDEEEEVDHSVLLPLQVLREEQTYSALQHMLYPNDCQCVLGDTKTYNCIKNGNFHSCVLRNYFRSHIHHLPYIEDLLTNRRPNIPNTFFPQVTPIVISEDEFTDEKRIIHVHCIKFLLEINFLGQSLPRTHNLNKYIGLAAILVYDHMFKTFNYTRTFTQFKNTTLRKINEFIKEEESNALRIRYLRELIPHISVKDLFLSWKRELEQQN